MFTTEWFTSTDGTPIYVYRYQANEQKAVLQFAHGMGEHAGRYQAFFSFLQANGITVIANDHRGHGKTGEKMGVMGFFAKEAGFETAVDDLRLIHQQLIADHPDVPQFMMGHSMGSFLVRRYIEKYPDDKTAVILSGTGYHQGLVGKAGILIAKLETLLFSQTHKSKLMDKLSFGRFQNHFKSGSWLSRDQAEVELYTKDPLSGFISTSQFFYDLLTGIDTLHKPKEVAKVNKGLAMLFISGTDDPVGDFTKGVKKAVRTYQDAGINHIDVTFYPGARHELIFETDRDVIIKDIHQWLIDQID